MTCMIGYLVIFSIAVLPNTINAGSTFYTNGQKSPGVMASDHEPAIAAFKKHVREYVKLREKVEGKLPKLSKDSTAKQIQEHKLAFEEAVRAVRTTAKPGDLFSPDITHHIRGTIRDEFKGKERQELRETTLEADTKGVPLRVNYSYPETKELTQIPPTLLLKLPELPKQVKYRFVGRHMLLVDRENGLILDFMLNALP